jgi:sphinganine-1-phosphate aldolase
MARASPFQGDDAGSIPVTRSSFLAEYRPRPVPGRYHRGVAAGLARGSNEERPVSESIPSIPAHGRSHEEVLGDLDAVASSDVDWHAGRAFSLVYHASDEHSALLKAAYTRYFSENGLNPLAFESLRRFEAEVVAMTAAMLNGAPRAAGTMTSGGSESIMMAVKTYRDAGRTERGIERPRLVLPASAHPAFFKACHYLMVEPVVVGLTDDFRVDVHAMRAAVTDDTVAVVGSAPCYPYGVVDPIGEIGALALDRGIGFHVDACLGGFLLPWVERLGHPVPPWDFRVEGVTSISADVHKYGFAAKGASTITYRDADLRRHQFYVSTDWVGGIYVSPTAAGTRPGGAIAAAWAAMQTMGEDGYLALAERIVDLGSRMISGIGAIPGLRVLGEPVLRSVFAFTSDDADVNIFAVGDVLRRRGWHPDKQIRPDALHMMITTPHVDVVEPFLTDLAEAVETVRDQPELATQGEAAMYGMLSDMPQDQQGEADDFVLQVLDGLYRPGAR